MTIDTTAPADTAEKSLREELQEAFTAAAVDDAPTDVTPMPATGETRTRDASGRFAGKQAAEDATIVGQAQRAAAPAASAAGTVAPGQGAAGAPPAPDATTAVAPPANLKPELRAAWDAAPPELRKYIADREAEVHKGFTRMDEERQFGKQLKDVIQPYMPLIQAQGGNPASAVQSLLNTAYIFTAGTPQQKAAALQQVAQQYQIPLEHVLQLSQQQPRIDPTVAAMQRELQELKQSRQQELNQRQQHEENQLQTEIATFAAGPGHDHFDQVKPHMAALLSNGLAKDLQDAYDQAVWARPDLRQTVLAAQQQTAEQARVTQAQARAAAAKQAAGSVTGTPGVTVPVGAPDRSLREELRANLRAAQN
jgi:hypothetical protein